MRFFRAISALWALAGWGCSPYPPIECDLDYCPRIGYEVEFRDSSWRRMDTLLPGRVALWVERAPERKSLGSATDCLDCMSLFTAPRLVCDQPILAGSGDTLRAGTDLMDSAIADRVGDVHSYGVRFREGTRFRPGPNRFEYRAKFRGKDVEAAGTLEVPDSLSFRPGFSPGRGP